MSPAPRPVLARTLFALAVAVQLVVLYAPSAPSTGELHGIDKVVHAAVFGAVAWTGRRAGLSWWPLVLVLLAHAALSEVVQGTLLPHRDGDVHDALADAAGVVIGAVLPVPAAPGRRTMPPWRTRTTGSPAGR